MHIIINITRQSEIADGARVVGRAPLAFQQSLDRSGVAKPAAVDLRGEHVTRRAF